MMGVWTASNPHEIELSDGEAQVSAVLVDGRVILGPDVTPEMEHSSSNTQCFLTALQARKLAQWLLQAADQMDGNG